MTVPTETSRKSYTGNGATTVFSTDFYFLAEADLKVKYTPSGGVEVVWTLGVDYTVTMPAAVGAAGSITAVVAPAAASSLVIERDVTMVQETSFRTQGQFSPAVHEDAMDRLMFAVHELLRRVGDLESAGAPGSVVAGNGLAFSGATLHVGAGSGIVSNADDVAVSYGLAASMQQVTKAANAQGVAVEVARIDHKHDAATAAPAAGSVAVGNAAAEGTSSSLARADHAHPVTAPAAPADVTKAAASAGASANVAREDHKHDVSTAAAVDITDATNAEGAATSLARSNHTHSHGARAGGALHAEATTATAGFLSAADKTKLDGLASETLSQGTTQTTDATPKTVLTWTPTNFTAEVVDLWVVAMRNGGNAAAGYHRQFTVKRYDGTTSILTAAEAIGTDREDTAGFDVTVSASSPAVLVQVTGAAATTVDWKAVARRVVAP